MPYGSPQIPDLPSSKINHLLQSRFSESEVDNILKAIVGHFVCAGFQSMVMTYSALRRGSVTKESYRLWVLSCVLVSSTLVLSSFLLYTVVIASAFLVKALLFYSLILVALLGLAMGLAAVILYDRNIKEQPSKAALNADQTLGYEDYEGVHPPSAPSATVASSSSPKTDNRKTE